MDIISHVSNVINSACSCGFTPSHIIESVFSCRSSETHVVFKAHLIRYVDSVGIYSADDLIHILSMWVRSGPTVLVNGISFSVDPTCTIKLNSLTDEDCTNHYRPNPPDSLNNTTIIWTCALGGAFLTVVVLTVTVALLSKYCVHRRKRLNLSK